MNPAEEVRLRALDMARDDMNKAETNTAADKVIARARQYADFILGESDSAGRAKTDE